MYKNEQQRLQTPFTRQFLVDLGVRKFQITVI